MLATLLPLLNVPAPDPLPQPAPSWLLWFLLILTFFLHILAMNFMVGGSLIGAVASRKARRGDQPHYEHLAGWLGKAMPVAVAATITLGVAPLLFLQTLYGRLFFTGSVLMGWFWLAVIPLLIVAYYGTYLVAFRGKSLGTAAGIVRWITFAIFLAIGFLYTNNMTLMLRADVFLERYLADPRGLQLNLDDPTLIPRYLHFMFAAVAVGGMAVALYGLIRRAGDDDFAGWAMRTGALWFAVPTAINLIFGFWWLVALPRETMLRFMGQNLVATISLAAGIVLGIGAMIMMFVAIYAPRPDGLVRGSLIALLLTLVTMVLARDQVRRGALEAAGFQPTTWVEPQWGNIALFVALLVAALGTVAWMVIALARRR
jgi:hypothetical protein